MSALENNKINSLARVLRSEGNVNFKHNGFFYEVFESADSGYVINVYSSSEHTEATLIDGGTCTGSSAIDAIHFML